MIFTLLSICQKRPLYNSSPDKIKQVEFEQTMLSNFTVATSCDIRRAFKHDKLFKTSEERMNVAVTCVFGRVADEKEGYGLGKVVHVSQRRDSVPALVHSHLILKTKILHGSLQILKTEARRNSTSHKVEKVPPYLYK